MPTELPLERLVAVETKMDMLLESQKDMAKSFKDFQGEQRLLVSSYVSRADYEKDLAELRLALETSKRKSALQTWLTGTLAALFGVVMTILIQSYFKQ